MITKTFFITFQDVVKFEYDKTYAEREGMTSKFQDVVKFEYDKTVTSL